MEINKALVRHILEHSPNYYWTLQGLGMLRLYLSGGAQRLRLHVWDSRFAVPGVSVIHNHPWDFTSYIIAGRLENHLFDPHPFYGKQYVCQSIKCGEGGGLEGRSFIKRMRVSPPMTYLEGNHYYQVAQQVHASVPQDGTVTVIERVFGGDQDHAQVFWEPGLEWVSAEPRPATEEEVRKICLNAIEKWF